MDFKNKKFITIDVEDWFHILDTPVAPPFDTWDSQESCFAKGLNRLLDLLAKHKVSATMFWLGYLAERHPDLVLRCQRENHEIASHGYAHLLAYKVGRKEFREDISKSKRILEDIIQSPVHGFRAAGFSTTNDTSWTFDEVRKAGYLYDSSVFPAARAHGGMKSSAMQPYTFKTSGGELWEFPQSVIEICGKRISLFGGGYLRLCPLPLICWGIHNLKKNNRPLIVYVHPREVLPDHPRMPLSPWRKFKSYCRLKTTYPKLDSLLETGPGDYMTMGQFVKEFTAL